MLVSLVIPCHNPPAGWAQNLVDRLHVFRAMLQDEMEVIVVRDGLSEHVVPTDTDFLKSHIERFHLIGYNTNRGKGHALRKGVEYAKGDVIIYTDIDLPYIDQSMFAIYDALKCGATNVVIGIKNDEYYSAMPIQRRFISKGLRRMIKTMFSLPVDDTQCGLKGFRSGVKPLFLQTTINGYLFDLEFVRSCVRSSVSLAAIPIVLQHNIQTRNLRYGVLLRELKNFIGLILR
jgi:glycosyltransferase involved in cell wall biosynthesis